MNTGLLSTDVLVTPAPVQSFGIWRRQFMENRDELRGRRAGREGQLLFYNLQPRSEGATKTQSTDVQLACESAGTRTLWVGPHAISKYSKQFSERTYPKNATERDQAMAFHHDRCMGGTPSRSSERRPSAGRMPTKPAASGMVPVWDTRA